MKLRFMGPVLTRVGISPVQIVSIQQSYLEFWNSVGATFQSEALAPGESEADIQFISEDSEITHSLAAIEDRQMLYESVYVDSPMLPAHAADLGYVLSDGFWKRVLDRCREGDLEWPGGASDEVVAAILEVLNFVPDTARLRLYYSGLANLQFEIRLDPKLFADTGNQAQTSAILNLVEWAGLRIFQEVATAVEETLTAFMTVQVKRFGAKLKGGIDIADRATSNWPISTRSLERGGPRSEGANDIGDGAQRAAVLWVSRSLILEQSSAVGSKGEISDVMAIWLSPVAQGDWRESLRTKGYSMQWLRYGMDEPAMAQHGMPLDDAWESMLFSQFFWAALETIEHEMFAVLGQISGEASGPRLKESHRKLSRVRERAELTLAHHQHLKRFLTRKRAELVDQIMDGWQFPALVRNLRDTIALCNQRHQSLLQRSNAKNSLLTDALLFFIGTVAIMELTVNLSLTGRTLSSDATLGLRNEGEFNVLELVAALPMDRLLFGSVVIIGVIVALYFRYRSRQSL